MHLFLLIFIKISVDSFLVPEIKSLFNIFFNFFYLYLIPNIYFFKLYVFYLEFKLMDFFEVIIFCTYVEKKRTIYIYFNFFVNFYLYYKFQRFFKYL